LDSFLKYFFVPLEFTLVPGVAVAEVVVGVVAVEPGGSMRTVVAAQ
jgi:hypothetical protein